MERKISVIIISVLISILTLIFAQNLKNIYESTSRSKRASSHSIFDINPNLDIVHKVDFESGSLPIEKFYIPENVHYIAGKIDTKLLNEIHKNSEEKNDENFNEAYFFEEDLKGNHSLNELFNISDKFLPTLQLSKERNDEFNFNLDPSLIKENWRLYTITTAAPTTKLSYAWEEGELKLKIEKEKKFTISIDGKTQEQHLTIDTGVRDSQHKYAIIIGGKVYKIENSTSHPVFLTNIDKDGLKDVHIVFDDPNILLKDSFEDQLWKKTADNCAIQNQNADISILQNTTDASDGGKSMELKAREDAACSFNKIELPKNLNFFRISFDYKNLAGGEADFQYLFQDNKLQKKFSLLSNNEEWKKFETSIELKKYSSHLGIYFYAKSKTSGKEVINLYDNIVVEGYKLASKTDLGKIYSETLFPITDPQPLTTFNSIKFESEEKPTIILKDNLSHINNNITMDCLENASPNPESIKIVDYTLEIKATNNVNCVKISTPINDTNKNYKISLKYLNLNGKRANLSILEKETDAIKPFVLTSENQDWQDFSTIINPSTGNKTIEIYLSSYSDDEKTIVNRFKDLEITQLYNNKVEESSFFMGSGLGTSNETPENLSYKEYFNGDYEISIKQASTPFVLVFSERYSNLWKASLKNNSLLSTNTHLKVNGYSNAWLINPRQLCQANTCTETEPGVYNMKILLSFEKSRYYYIAMLSSILPLLTAIIYLKKTWKSKK